MNYRLLSVFVITFMTQFTPLRLIEYKFKFKISLHMHLLHLAFLNQQTMPINLFVHPY
jgi:hypothetical protein